MRAARPHGAIFFEAAASRCYTGGMNLLIVEDDVEHATLLASELRAMNHRVAVAETGRAALVEAARESFDAIVLDCMLPELDGASVVRVLRERGQLLPVLMFSALGRSAEKVAGLEAGADDYVVKPTSTSEIDARLKALVRARNWTDGEADLLRVGAITISPGQHRAWYEEEPLDLSKLEFRLLVELARHAGSFISRRMLIERVWGYDFEPSTNIVDGQVRLLRRKLTANGRADPILTKRGVGYGLRS